MAPQGTDAARHGRIFVRVVIGVLLICIACVICTYWRIYGYEKLFRDFFVFRDASVALAQHQLGSIYDIARIRRITAAAGHLKEFPYFLNPPTGLFLIWPLAYLPPVPGLVLWTLFQIIVLFSVLRMDYFQTLFAGSDPKAAKTCLLLTITTLAFGLQNILFGQVALLCAALFLLVMAWRAPHPVRAGIVLGLFSFKPQLGLLLPLLLIAEGRWKVLLWAAATAALMALLSTGLWGANLWSDYREILAYRSAFLSENPTLLFFISTSPYAAMRLLGVPAVNALWLQGGIAFLLVLWLWPVLRHGKERDKLLMLIPAAYLVSPYTLIYDMVLLALPCAWALRRAETGNTAQSELIALVLLILMPVATLLLQLAHIPYSVIAIGFALGVARRLANDDQPVNAH